MLDPKILIGVAIVAALVLFALMRPSFLNKNKFSTEGAAALQSIMINSLKLDDEATSKDSFENRVTNRVIKDGNRLDSLYVERKYRGPYGISTRKPKKTAELAPEQEVIAKPDQVKQDEPVVVKSEQIKSDEPVVVKSEQVEPVEEVVVKASQVKPGEQVVVKKEKVKSNEVVITKPKSGKPSQAVLKEDVPPADEVVVKSEQVNPDAVVVVKASQVKPNEPVLTESQKVKPNENVVTKPAQVKPDENVVVKVKQTDTSKDVTPVDEAGTGLLNTPVVENYRVDYLGSRSNMDGPFSMNKSRMTKGYDNMRQSGFQPDKNLVRNMYSVHHQNAGF